MIGTGQTPIYDQLVVETAVRKLQVDLRPAFEAFRETMVRVGHQVRRFLERYQEAIEAQREWNAGTLERIREDQASLERWTLSRPVSPAALEAVQAIRAQLEEEEHRG